MYEENLKQQEESVKKQEAMRRGKMEYHAYNIFQNFWEDVKIIFLHKPRGLNWLAKISSDILGDMQVSWRK